LKYTLVISDKGLRKKVTKIIPYNDGGFSILAPYHSARKGYLLKHTVDYSKLEVQYANPESFLAEYNASDRVKLSYHSDGFVQFSGENKGKIISGRDKDTGEPKGLGYFTNPISNPIRTGPSFGITLWGLEDFEEFQQPKSGETVVEFTEEDLYFRSPPNSCNGYIIEGFVFPERYWAGVRKIGDNLYLTMTFYNFQATGAVMNLKIVPLHRENSLIGLVASNAQISFPNKSGFVLGAPAELGPTTKSTRNIMHAIYPLFNPLDPDKTLDYLPIENN
jgi:hypothetical protein